MNRRERLRGSMGLENTLRRGMDYGTRNGELVSSFRVIATALTLAATALVGCAESDERCEPFVVYAQHRWPPDGAALRSEPNRASEQIGSFGGNTPILIDGYIEVAEPAYPNNPPEYQGYQWLHYIAGGWVTSAAVRATRIENFDPTGRQPDGGPPAVLPRECFNAIKP